MIKIITDKDLLPWIIKGITIPSVYAYSSKEAWFNSVSVLIPKAIEYMKDVYKKQNKDGLCYNLTAPLFLIDWLNRDFPR